MEGVTVCPSIPFPFHLEKTSIELKRKVPDSQQTTGPRAGGQRTSTTSTVRIRQDIYTALKRNRTLKLMPLEVEGVTIIRSPSQLSL